MILNFTDGEAGVVSAKAERIADGDADFSLLRLPGNIVYFQVAGGVDIVEIDGRGDDGFFDSLAADNQFNGTGCAEGVAERAFGGANGQFISVLAENRADSDTFSDIIKLSAGSVCVDVIDFFHGNIAIGKGKIHSLCGTICRRKVVR